MARSQLPTTTEKKLSVVLSHPEARLEPEFYLAPDGVQERYVLGKDAVPFVQYGTSNELNDEGAGFPVLRLNEISCGFVEEAEKSCAMLSRTDFENLQLKKGDVLICRTNGNPQLVGKSAVVMSDIHVAFASYLFRARPDASIISPEALMVFLNSSKGRLEIEKHSIRSNQVNFSPERLRQARIPKFGLDLLRSIDESVGRSYTRRRLADTAYAEGMQTLLTALNLDTWQAPQPLTYTRRASEAFAASRVDAEHFEPKYKAMLDHICARAHRCRQIKDIAEFCERGEQPEYFAEGALPVIGSRHILEFGLDYENFERTNAEYWDRRDFKTARVFRNDILTYTTGAKVGRTASYLSDEHALASNHVNVVRLREENPLYVAVVMNSMIGRWQTRMLVTGSAQVELYPHDIGSFVIPFVDAQIGAEVASAVERAHSARQEAHMLLDRAKRAVEIAIEQNETAALESLESEI